MEMDWRWETGISGWVFIMKDCSQSWLKDGQNNAGYPFFTVSL